MTAFVVDDIFLSRLRWRCRRGMRELDVLLSRFLDEEFETAAPEKQEAFLELVSLQDPEILDLLTGRATSDDATLNDVIQRLLTNH
jgi:antitoxin CptB